MRVSLPAPEGYSCTQAEHGGLVYAVTQHSRNGPVVGFVRQLRTYGKGGHRSRMRWFYALAEPAGDARDPYPDLVPGKWHTHSRYTNPLGGTPGAGHATAREAIARLVDHLAHRPDHSQEPY